MEKGEIDPKHLPPLSTGQMGTLLTLLNAIHFANPFDRPRVLVKGLVEVTESDFAGLWVKISTDHFQPVVLSSGGVAAGITVRAEDFVDAQRALRTRSPVVLCRPEAKRRSMISLCCGWSDHTSVMGIWRERGVFEEYHRTLLYLLHNGTHWILEKERSPVPELPLGTRKVLELMLTGMSEKQIARRLDRSVHTVHSHIKRVYRHYNVRSRPELMLTFFDRRSQAVRR